MTSKKEFSSVFETAMGLAIKLVPLYEEHRSLTAEVRSLRRKTVDYQVEIYDLKKEMARLKRANEELLMLKMSPTAWLLYGDRPVITIK